MKLDHNLVRFNENYLHLQFLLGLMLAENPERAQKTLPKKIWFPEQTWFLQEITKLTTKIFPSRTLLEYREILNQLVEDYYQGI